jgi:hypothetical protein
MSVGLGLTGLVLNLPLDEIDVSELRVPQASGKDGKNTPGKSPSTPRNFLESTPKDGLTQNTSNHLSVPSRTRTPSPSNGKSSVPVQQKDKTPSPKPTSTKPKPVVFSWEATKLSNPGAESTKPGAGLFGSTTDISSGSAFGEPSSKAPSGEKADRKPSSGLFGSTSNTGLEKIHALGTSMSGSPFGKTSSTKPATSLSESAPRPAFGGGFGGGLFGAPITNTSTSTKPHTSLFGSTPNPASRGGFSFGAAPSIPSPGSSGLFDGIASAKNDNSLK